MDKYRKIMATVMKQAPENRHREIRRISDTMALSVDESPPMVAIMDGAATLAALYDLCIIHRIDTTHEMLEIQERVEYLIAAMQDDMREMFPSRQQKKEVDDI